MISKKPIKCAPHWSKEHLRKVKRSMHHILWEWSQYGSSELPGEVRARVRDLIDAIRRMEVDE
tara:strand:+ start:61 stop:249 length:189 start_codon:yes stop_codon:yes gene_type:complete